LGTIQVNQIEGKDKAFLVVGLRSDLNRQVWKPAKCNPDECNDQLKVECEVEVYDARDPILPWQYAFQTDEEWEQCLARLTRSSAKTENTEEGLRERAVTAIMKKAVRPPPGLLVETMLDEACRLHWKDAQPCLDQKLFSESECCKLEKAHLASESEGGILKASMKTDWSSSLQGSTISGTDMNENM